ncbi:MAG: ribonuclease H-like domain-containing protein, partial [candidate division Zixibacteria bacterium]|nr:ribonuclease H-like domain-containing protein [candidate division Zixibacteria bacterium]
MSRYDKIIQRFSDRLTRLEKETRAKEFTESEITRQRDVSAFSPGLTEYEYLQAQELKGELIEKYQDLTLNKVIPGEKITNVYGSFYYIFEEINEKCCKSEKENFEETIYTFFSLLPGIRDHRENQLKKAGYKSIEDLISHPRWNKEAEYFLQAVSRKDNSRLNEILCRRLPKSHPLILSLSSLHPWEDFLFLDIETLGLFGGNLVILIGVARLEKGEKINLHQFLALEVKDEIALLKAFSEYLLKSKSIVSFNGKAFDVPFL